MKIPEYKDLLKKKPKYRNVKTNVGDITFHSKKEAARYCTLKLMETAGVITAFILQPKIPIIIDGKRICYYIGDFGYFKDGVQIIEDCKGMKTQVYILKNKLIKALYNIEILET